MGEETNVLSASARIPVVEWNAFARMPGQLVHPFQQIHGTNALDMFYYGTLCMSCEMKGELAKSVWSLGARWCATELIPCPRLHASLQT